MRQAPPRIPRVRLREGVTRCLEQSLILLKEARVLAEESNQYAQHAGVLFSYAVEEFGKAALLREALAQPGEELTIEDFYNHPAKFAKAARLIEAGYLELKGSIAQRGFDVGVLGNLESRLQEVYVDWDADRQGWRAELNVDAQRLIRNIEFVLDVLEETLVEWRGASG